MILAVIWHWWIGLILLIVGGGAALGLIASYLKSVTSMRYPGGRRGREQDL